MSHITQQELETYLWGAAVLLRGTIDAGDYKQFIFPLLFYKRLCDVFDEETQLALAQSDGDEQFAAFPENHRFQIPPAAHWREIRQVAKEVGQALQQGMRAIESANPHKLYGIFGDAQWTNKERLPDAMLRDLVEHFNRLELTIANLPEDELGRGYEYLIKKFADDSGHTAAEFYTNRTVVHLMTEMLKPRPGEAIYDPTCGSGGMLLSAIAHLRRAGEEWRNVRLFGQERNLMTSAIARMNCFLHGIEDFRIERGDTLSEPKLHQGDALMRFDVVLANPPYSIKQWDRSAFSSDPWGRNLFGVPPQGRADYAFWQHILKSLDPLTGRCAILFPHGVLFRQEEAEMRRAICEADLIECVLGLGPNLFYNSPMEACVVICRTQKPPEKQGKILFINALHEVSRERAQSFLTPEHIAHIVEAYQSFQDEAGFARVVGLDEIRQKGHKLTISLYCSPAETTPITASSNLEINLEKIISDWLHSGQELRQMLRHVLGEEFNPPDLLLPQTIAQELPKWIDRSQWKIIPFGAFAEQVNERVEPINAADEIYVGLEHLDPQNLHIQRWGKGSDVTGTKLRFRKGDIIFGRRRAYQRKLAVAQMDGICSAHAMVVRAKPTIVLPEFLPFLMMSDHFMNRAVEISVGSLSPTINWSTMKIQEFALPPLDQQRRLAALLWAIDEVLVDKNKMNNALIDLIQSQINDVISHSIQNWGVTPLSKVLIQKPQYGANASATNFQADKPRYIRITDIDDNGKLKPFDIVGSGLNNEEIQQYLLQDGDLLIARTGNTIGKSYLYTELDGHCVYASYLIRFRPKSNVISPDFLFMITQSSYYKNWIKNTVHIGAQPNINGTEYASFLIPLPPITFQEEFIVSLKKLKSLQENNKLSISAIFCLKNLLSNEFFSQ